MNENFDLIGPTYPLWRSEEREEILERWKWSNDFEIIERGAVWGESQISCTILKSDNQDDLSLTMDF